MAEFVSRWRGAAINPDVDLEVVLVCALTVWFWDRGHQEDFEEIISRALREGWKCPRAFVAIHDDIRAARRVVSKKRLAKLKVPALRMFELIAKRSLARRIEQELLPRNQPHKVRLRPDPEPHAARRQSEARERSAAKRLAAGAGISVATLDREEREFRQLLADFSEK